MSEVLEDFLRIGSRYGRHLRIVLPDAVSPSWNPTYAGRHWSNRVEEVDRARIEMMAALHELAIWPETFMRPVHIIVSLYKESHPLDCDNVMAKYYIDALKLNGIIVDDGIKWVVAVTTISRVDREYPRIEIDVQEVA